MDYKAKIEIDVQEAFDELRPREKEEFIKNNLSVLDIEDLIGIVKTNGYQVISNADFSEVLKLFKQGTTFTDVDLEGLSL